MSAADSPPRPLAEDHTRIWALAMIEAWHEIRQAHFSLRGLRPPNFIISTELHHALGLWETTPRRLTLAARLFEHCRWEQVIETLKHEMAHQIVAELYGERHAAPHGALFARACALLGITAETRAPLQAPVAGHETVAARIHKLLALGQSSNPHEAELALAKAHELALRHNLKLLAQAPDAHDTRAFGLRLFGPPMRRVPAAIWGIANLVSEFYFTLYIGRSYRDEPGQAWRILEFCGSRDNLDLAEYVYGFLTHQVEHQWESFRQANPRVNGRLRNSFIMGLLAGFRRQLEGQRRHLAETQALVWVGDPGLKTYYRQRNPQVRNKAVRLRHDQAVHEAGHAVGEKLRLSPGLSPQARRRHLELGS